MDSGSSLRYGRNEFGSRSDFFSSLPIAPSSLTASVIQRAPESGNHTMTDEPKSRGALLIEVPVKRAKKVNTLSYVHHT
jgi:hypothetical protein